MRENVSPGGIYFRVNEFNAERPTVVFVHGLSGSSSAWRDYELYFNKKYNVVSFDIRGHGRSAKWPAFADYDMSKLAADVEELAKLLGLPSFFLVAHSFGVPIALEYARAHKNRVMGLIFLTPIFTAKKVRFATMVLAPLDLLSRLFGRLPFKKEPGDGLDYDRYENRGFWQFKRVRDDIKNTTPRIYLYCLKHIYRYDGERILPEITAPTLIIHGSADSVVPAAYVKRTASLIPHSRLRLLPGANHLLILNAADSVKNEVEAFVSENYREVSSKIQAVTI